MKINQWIFSNCRFAREAAFDYDYVADDMWREVICDGQDVFKIWFDLENDDDITKPFDIAIEGCKFTCQAFAAGGDWENSVLYYRCQLKDTTSCEVVSFGETLFKNLNAFFVFIPKKEDGNTNLVKCEDIEDNERKGGWCAGQDSKESGKIDERKGRKALKDFLQDCCKPIKR
jgi:hypothetical protein